MQGYIIVNRSSEGYQLWGTAQGNTPQEALEAHVQRAEGEHGRLLRESGREGVEFFVAPSPGWPSSQVSASLTEVQLFRVKPATSYTVEVA